jgi:protein arginine N-methyltransferase 2
VQRMCADHPYLAKGLNVLNIGFGLGIIDGFFQSTSTPPALHIIIEPHSDVLAHMRATGWFDKPNVKVLEGKWQDFVEHPDLLSVGGFDIVYTDTFSEDYHGKALQSLRSGVTQPAS